MYGHRYFVMLLAILSFLPSFADSIHIENTKKAMCREYDKKHPLLYEDSWDLWPYSFLNENGEPSGYNVDLLKLMLTRLNIPFEIHLKHYASAKKDMVERRSDLIMGFSNYRDPRNFYAKSIVCILTNSILSSKAKEVRINNIYDLCKHRVIVHGNSFSHNELRKANIDSIAIIHDDMKSAVTNSHALDSCVVLWNTMSLKFLMNKYHLNNAILKPINMPHGEFTFVSGDTMLLNKLDSVYEIIESSDNLAKLRQKWFYPEEDKKRKESDDIITNILLSLGGVVLLLILCLAYYKIKEKQVKSRYKKQNSRLALYLKSSKKNFWICDVRTERFCQLRQDGSLEKEINLYEYTKINGEDCAKQTMDTISDIVDGKYESKTLIINNTNSKKGDDDEYYDLHISVLRKENGKPTAILGTKHNMTKERQEQINTKNTLLKYKTIFELASIDMVFYDCNGHLKNANNKACKTFSVRDREKLLKSDFVLNTFAYIKKYFQGSSQPLNFTTRGIMKNNFNATDELFYMTNNEVSYYETMIIPVFSEKKKLMGLFITGTDRTETVKTIKKEKDRIKVIKENTDNIREYVDNINFILLESNISLANYYPSSRTLFVTNNLNNKPIEMSQLRCYEHIDASDKQSMYRLLNNIDKKRIKTFSVRFKSILKDQKERDIYIAINGIFAEKSFNKEEHYLCLCRDESEQARLDLMMNQKKQKAQEAENIKNTFLMNMSHEIRTPLNAVIGFSELFQVTHDIADEALFINEIKSNADMLLQLINDILYLSRLDANMIEIKKQPTDFADMFEAFCEMGFTNHINSGVLKKIKNHFVHLVIDIDAEKVGMAMEYLINFAAKNTTKGQVSVRYTYHNKELMIIIEDTSAGIDSEKLSMVFDRSILGNSEDVYTDRLKMLIAQKLIIEMGGRVDIDSIVGHGTTIWIVLPCDAQQVEKKIKMITNQ